ncbi:MAG: molybdate ABC transporter substrate-binding protein [Chromatiales bacterium]|nr:molybdate ABC transporter substrate-binding protein [Chromatiales bacterium]
MNTHRTIEKRGAFAALFFLTLILFHSPSTAETVTLAVAANFTEVTAELVSRFEQHSGHRAKVSYGSTGKLYAQIKHGAPFDLFLAADEERPKRLVEEGDAIGASRFTYARGELVLWSADEGLFSDGEAYLKRGEITRLAIANPQTAPYGVAAQQLLHRLGRWESLMPHLVRGDSITQTFQFVATGNAETGLVAASQLRSWPHRGSVWRVPQHYHAPIAQQAVLLKRAERNPAAQAFVHYLASDEAKRVIRDFGYVVE